MTDLASTRLDPLIRPATEDDIGGIDKLLDGHDAVSGAPPLRSGVRAAYLRLALRRGTVHVAQIAGVIVGFGTTLDTGRAVHLADLFVDREFLGRGIGGRLLPGLFGDRWPRTTFASDDPRAMPLYMRAGMSPLWPNVYVTADERFLPDVAPGYDVEPATAAQIAAIEVEWTGVDRSADHAIWADREGAQPFVVRRAGTVVAIVQARRRIRGEGRWIDRMRVAPDANPLGTALAAMRCAAAPGQEIGACIPGPNPALGALVRSGFRVVDGDTFMASEPDLVDPIRTFVDPEAP
jgi:acetyltransferase (GNAT) family protein